MPKAFPELNRQRLSRFEEDKKLGVNKGIEKAVGSRRTKKQRKSSLPAVKSDKQSFPQIQSGLEMRCETKIFRKKKEDSPQSAE